MNVILKDIRFHFDRELAKLNLKPVRTYFKTETSKYERDKEVSVYVFGDGTRLKGGLFHLYVSKRGNRLARQMDNAVGREIDQWGHQYADATDAYWKKEAREQRAAEKRLRSPTRR